ncbi:MAG TPA: hypothetical protein VN597_06730, partial [Streptosporangiaceae bacterium]|nr:hypothetical protein [Streptosporangiaceae bacterium]
PAAPAAPAPATPAAPAAAADAAAPAASLAPQPETHAMQAIPVALLCCSPVINHASLPASKPTG